MARWHDGTMMYFLLVEFSKHHKTNDHGQERQQELEGQNQSAAKAPSAATSAAQLSPASSSAMTPEAAKMKADSKK